jgi:hypothetical protein
MGVQVWKDPEAPRKERRALLIGSIAGVLTALIAAATFTATELRENIWGVVVGSLTIGAIAYAAAAPERKEL